MQESVSSRILLSKKGVKTFGERRKGERSSVVSLLPGFHDCLASRNPRVLSQKYGGRMYDVLAWSAKVRETGQEIGFLYSQERRKEISK
jgi:hypothetical protein